MSSSISDKHLWILVFSLTFGGCSKPQASFSSADKQNQGEDIEFQRSMDRRDASVEECAEGGSVYSFFEDYNGDGVLDNGDSVLHVQKVCNGINGKSLVFSITEAPLESCLAGGSIFLIAQDNDGSGDLSSEDSNLQSATVCNGDNGEDGEDAPATSYTPVEAIEPCPGAGSYKEVVLRLQNGQVLASLSNHSNGNMTRLSFLPDGNYVTTDSSNCQFSLSSSEDEQTRSMSWYSQVQKTWSMVQ